MSSRLPIVAGVLAGVVAAAAIGMLLVASGPAPIVSLATPSPPVAASPGRSATAASPGPGTSPATSAVPGTSASAAPPSAGGGAAFHIGEVAPPLSVPQVGGGTIDLAALHGKPVWVNFMATTCPPCVDEFPLMNGFAARHAEDGLVVLAVDVKEEEGVVAAFAQSLNATFPIGLDADGSAQDAWDAVVLPVHFWVGADGVVREGALGGIGPDTMADGLRTIMPGVNVTP